MSWNTSTPSRSTCGRQQGARRDHPHPRAHRVEQRDVRARDPAVQHVAADRHGEPAEPALAAADGQRVEQRLGRVLVAAVAGVDHRAVDLFRQQLHRARFGMAHHQHVGVHRVQGHRGVDQRLALAHRADRDRHVDDVGAEPLAGELERGAGAGRVLEEAVDQGAAAQRRVLLFGLAVLLDIALGEVEDIGDVLGRQPFDAQQMPVPVGMGIHKPETIGRGRGCSKVSQAFGSQPLLEGIAGRFRYTLGNYPAARCLAVIARAQSRPFETMKKLLPALVLMSAVAAFAPAGFAAAPVPEFTGGVVPSLAPMLANVTPGVVNIAVKGRVREQNPLLQDPFFRRFFNLPQGQQYQERETQAAGSGVIVDAKPGYVLTNAHVVEDATSIDGHDQGRPQIPGQAGRPRCRYRRRGAEDRARPSDRGAARRFRQAAGRRLRRRHRQSVRARADGHLGHRQRLGPQRPRHRGLRGFHPDRRVDQSRQFRRRAGQPARAADRHQHRDRRRRAAAMSASASRCRSTWRAG